MTTSLSSPFPGVDPFVESQGFWPDFHASFVTYWCDYLADRLPDHYEARINELIEEEVRETFIQILHRPDHTLVAVLELLSPANKEGPTHGEYVVKRNAVLRQPIHLVEVDLLLAGHRLPLRGELPPGDFYALVSRADRRPDCDVYAWSLKDSLPTIPIPLIAPDPDLHANLGAVFATTYQRGRYRRSIRYEEFPPMVVADDLRQWIRSQLAASAATK